MANLELLHLQVGWDQRRENEKQNQQSNISNLSNKSCKWQAKKHQWGVDNKLVQHSLSQIQTRSPHRHHQHTVHCTQVELVEKKCIPDST